MPASRIQDPSILSLPTPSRRGNVLAVEGSSVSWASGGSRHLRLPYMGNRFILGGAVFGYDQSLTCLTHGFGRSNAFTLTGFSSAAAASGEQYGRFPLTLTNNGILRTNGQEVLPSMYPYYWSFTKVVDNVDGAMIVGLNSLTTPTSGTTATNNSAYFWCRNGTHTNWQAVTRDGTTSNTQDTGIALDTNWHLFEVESNDGGTTWLFYIDGVLKATSSSNVPVTSTVLYGHVTNINVASSTREYQVKSFGVAAGDPASAAGWQDIESLSAR